ncbi:MAG: 4,5-DOPA dioxygenase extradiol [Bacteroidota bacterium]
MDRRRFLNFSSTLAVAAMSSTQAARSFFQHLPVEGAKMPVLFIGHGSPMNAIDDNEFTQGWKALVKDIPTPKAILCISAHWETRGTKVLSAHQPRMIYDMYGFPKALYEAQYPAPGAPELAEEISQKLPFNTIALTDEWGFDHGTWSILLHMYPQANIPCFQLSLNKTRDLQWHYDLAKELAFLRKKGVLIVGSGNIVHNLRYIRQMLGPSPEWALEFDQQSTDLIQNRAHEGLIHYERLGKSAAIAVNSAEHYIPMLYTVALQERDDALSFANHTHHTSLMGTMMRCLKIG